MPTHGMCAVDAGTRPEKKLAKNYFSRYTTRMNVNVEEIVGTVVNVFDLRYWDDPVLSMVCDPVRDSEFGPKLEKYAERMIVTMGNAKGWGLASPQVGVPIRMFVMKFPDTSGAAIAVCNPTLELSGPIVHGQEGCLSLPSIFSQVERSEMAVMRYFTPSGVEQELPLTGLDARVAQHEYDHTMGIMFISRLPRQLRRAAEREWEKAKHRYVKQ